MSSFPEVSELFKNEILNSPQYQIGLKIKDLLKADILAPNVNYTFKYYLEDSDYTNINNKEHEEVILTFSLKLILGVRIEIINRLVIVTMKDFL
jgi:hypothetical protein